MGLTVADVCAVHEPTEQTVQPNYICAKKNVGGRFGREACFAQTCQLQVIPTFWLVAGRNFAPSLNHFLWIVQGSTFDWKPKLEIVLQNSLCCTSAQFKFQKII